MSARRRATAGNGVISMALVSTLGSGCVVINDGGDDGASTTGSSPGTESTAGTADEGSTGMEGIACGDPGTRSSWVGGQCLCEAGYTWCAPANPDDFTCCPITGGDPECNGEENIHIEGDVCVCDSGYSWCNPEDLEDLSCCEDEMMDTDTETSTGSGSSTG